MQKIKFITLLLVVFSYSAHAQKKTPSSIPYRDRITADDLRTSLHFIASDNFNGRLGGTADEKLAAEYLASNYALWKIPALSGQPTNAHPLEKYFQSFEFDHANKKWRSQNVIAVLEGSDPVLKQEAILILAHYDHLGKDTTLAGDQIYNGAADDGSGTVALLHIAKSLAVARDRGEGPKRSVIFFHSGAEESGIHGSAHFVHQAPTWPLDKIVATINMDGVGGIDKTNLGDNRKYVYVLHVDSTSRHLYQAAKRVNEESGLKLELLYPKNANRFGSDDRHFNLFLVPTIYFSTGLTEQYHKLSDEASTVDYAHMALITKLVFSLTWDLANTQNPNLSLNRKEYIHSGQYYCMPCGCNMDNKKFDQPGTCPACAMTLAPLWRKKS